MCERFGSCPRNGNITSNYKEAGKNSLAVDPRRRGDWFGEQLTCLSHDACASLIVNCFGYQCRSEDMDLRLPMPLVAERS